MRALSCDLPYRDISCRICDIEEHENISLTQCQGNPFGVGSGDRTAGFHHVSDVRLVTSDQSGKPSLKTTLLPHVSCQFRPCDQFGVSVHATNDIRICDIVQLWLP